MFGMQIMCSMDFAGLDLNLLRLLDALLTERHLTRAGRRVGLSQPAMSHGLARLRRHLDDPLFVRSKDGLVPTERAERLAEPLRDALDTLERALTLESFAPTEARRSFTLATADYGAFVLVPRLLSRLTAAAPGVDLWVRAVADDTLEQLTRGEADAALVANEPPGLGTATHSRVLFEERFVCLVRKDHPRVKRKLDLDTWCELPHAFVAPRGTAGGVVDDVLATLGRTRRVACAVPHFLVAPHVVAGSDLILTVGARVAETFARLMPLRIVEPPVELPKFRIRMVWHERQHRDAAQRWFRDSIAGTAQQV